MTDLFDVMLHEICPEPMRKLPKVRALSWAFRGASERIERYVKKSMVNVDIDSLDIEVVDALAAEIEAPYYDDTADEDTRRQTLKDAVLNYMQAGSPAAVERMVDTVFGTGRVTEWMENGMDPYLFGIETTAQFTPDTMAQLEQIVRSVKNVRSALASATGIRDVEAEWKHGFGSWLDSKQPLLNDVNIDESGQAYPIGEYFAMSDISEAEEDITLFKAKRTFGARQQLSIAMLRARDSLSSVVDTPEESGWPNGIYAGLGMAQDTKTVLTEEA